MEEKSKSTWEEEFDKLYKEWSFKHNTNLEKPEPFIKDFISQQIEKARKEVNKEYASDVTQALKEEQEFALMHQRIGFKAGLQRAIELIPGEAFVSGGWNACRDATLENLKKEME